MARVCSTRCLGRGSQLGSDMASTAKIDMCEPTVLKRAYIAKQKQEYTFWVYTYFSDLEDRREKLTKPKPGVSLTALALQIRGERKVEGVIDRTSTTL